MRQHTLLLLLFSVFLLPLPLAANSFSLCNSTIVYSHEESKQVVRAIGDFQADVQRVTGFKPLVANKKVKGANIIIGTYGKSKLINELIKQGRINENDLKNHWESYVISVTDEPVPTLIIAGSDMRGTIYGIYDVSQRIGVSPWYWWADVPVKKHTDVSVDIDYYASGEPSVKYRGIFINDEDWGLQPWAARKFLMAQLNQELAGKLLSDEANWAAHQSCQAYDSINALFLEEV